MCVIYTYRATPGPSIREGNKEKRGRVLHHFVERAGKDDVGDIEGISKQRGDLLVSETGDSASYPGYIEGELWVLTGKVDEFVDVGFDGLYPTLHGGYGIAVPLESDPLSVDGSELFKGDTGCTSHVMTK